MKRFATGILTYVLMATMALAQSPSPPPFPDFTFKRVTPPEPGSTNRITIQIDPDAALPLPTPQDQVILPPDAPIDVLPWVGDFWSAVSPDLTAAAPGRLIDATTYVQTDASLPTPSLSALQNIAGRFGREILSASIGTRVSPALVLAVIATESSGQSNAVSSAGAQGLMQLMPATAERFEVTDAFDTAQNIRGGVAYLDWLLHEFGDDAIFALAGYNAGENAVLDNAGIPPFAETRAYVPKVIAAWSVARNLCITPPELASDGCVFISMAAN